MTEQYVEQLIQKYADGTASEEEIEQLMQWYRSAPIDEVRWPSSKPSEQDKVYHRMYNRLQQKISRKTSVDAFTWWKVAAILLIIPASAFLLFYYLKPFSTSYITVVNPSGKIQMVKLPDSSSVWLNAATMLHYSENFTKNREVEIEGEAYFDVTHDVSHPFKVSAGNVETTVVGTSFNIKAYRSQKTTSVSVINGRVKVSANLRQLALLTPAMQLHFDKQTRKAKTIAIDTNAVLAWKKGKLQFQGETFAEIAVVLENWYGVKITFANPGMKACRYYMSFDNTVSIEKLLSTMAEISELEYAFDKHRDTLTLSGKECR